MYIKCNKINHEKNLYKSNNKIDNEINNKKKLNQEKNYENRQI